MDICVTFSGYRCFSPENPVQVTLQGEQVAFLGLNNAGKSTLLKAFYDFRDIFKKLSASTDDLRAVVGGHDIPFRIQDFTSVEDIFWHHDTSDIKISIEVPPCPDFLSRVDITIRNNSDRFRVLFYDTEGNAIPYNQLAGEGTRLRTPTRVYGDLRRIFDAFASLAQCIYVPSVRHATPFTPDSAHMREGAFFDIKIGKPFIESWDSLQRGSGKHQTEKIASVIQDLRRIFGFETLDFMTDAGRRTMIAVVNGKSVLLSDLGSGLSQFVVLLGNLAFANPSYVLIDEPESNLHPSLQLQFLEAVAARSKYGVLFATHSLGLARSAADRTYVVQSRPDGSRLTEYSAYPNLAELLGELSFRSYEQVGFDKILLVEGKTDVRTIEELLNHFDKGEKCFLLPLHGSQLINGRSEEELAQVTKASPHVFALIDSERNAGEELAKDRRAFLKTCDKLGIKHHALQKRAIENYFTDKAVKKTKGDRFRALRDEESLLDNDPRWPKSENWRIARNMTREELTNSDLGKFLESI
jgi:ABC-type cobalamin/Fe3+-siderophores transport system ATPase subunit